jgi:hypothetical protein
VQVALVAFTIVTGTFTIAALFLQLTDWLHGRGVIRTRRIPIQIRRSLSHTSYLHGIDLLNDALEADHFHPKARLAVNYGGLSPAAELARRRHIPVVFIEVELGREEGGFVARDILLPPELNTSADWAVLILDNGIRSGRTLQKVIAAVVPSVHSVKSCVIYKGDPADGNYCEPDYLVFTSERPFTLLK